MQFEKLLKVFSFFVKISTGIYLGFNILSLPVKFRKISKRARATS